MKINKIIEKYFFFQYLYIFPFGIVFHLVILDNFSLIEATLYSFVLSGISTFFLYSKIKQIFNYKENINKFEIETVNSKSDLTELITQLNINKFWSNNIIQESENQLLIVSNISILAYQELLLINYNITRDKEFNFEIISDKSKSSLSNSKKNSFKNEIKSKL